MAHPGATGEGKPSDAALKTLFLTAQSPRERACRSGFTATIGMSIRPVNIWPFFRPLPKFANSAKIAAVEPPDAARTAFATMAGASEAVDRAGSPHGGRDAD